jgi:hypothetical protein
MPCDCGDFFVDDFRVVDPGIKRGDDDLVYRQTNFTGICSIGRAPADEVIQ